MGLFNDFWKRGREGAQQAKGLDPKAAVRPNPAPAPKAPITPQAAPRPAAPTRAAPAAPAPTPARTYTVKAGDTLSAIAQRTYGDPQAFPKIFAANRDILTDPDEIQPGQTLKLP